MQDFEMVELELEEMEKNKPNLGSGGYSAIGQPGGLTPLHVAGYDRGFRLPRSVKDEEEWGHTLITLPAMKDLKLSYLEFVGKDWGWEKAIGKIVV